jgi:hypothetical protein
MRAAPKARMMKARMMTERMIRIMAGGGLVAILSFSWLGQAAAGARTQGCCFPLYTPRIRAHPIRRPDYLLRSLFPQRETPWEPYGELKVRHIALNAPRLAAGAE